MKAKPFPLKERRTIEGYTPPNPCLPSSTTLQSSRAKLCLPQSSAGTRKIAEATPRLGLVVSTPPGAAANADALRFPFRYVRQEKENTITKVASGPF